MHLIMVQQLKEKVLNGGHITRDEAIYLSKTPNKKELYEASEFIRKEMAGNNFDTCSIINARSGRCSEDCKWCSQSVLFKTKVDSYELVDEESCMRLASRNAKYGINRFSFVTSGRTISDKNLDKICEYAVKIRKNIGIKLCASMGLLNKSQLKKLNNAGVTRIHCNLESSERFFPTLCKSHTWEDKINTLKDAISLGMTVCSGGIIGMGETMEDRIDMELKIRELGITSSPVNILNPIPGTPLEGRERLSDEEIFTTIAVFRFINPSAYLRFAGGRILIEHIEEEAMKIGINSAIMGDMLTTPGAKILNDLEKIKDVGYVIEHRD